MQAPLSKRLVAEFIGTFWLVFTGCGAAIFSAAFPDLGIGYVGVALAFGLSVLTMAYAVGHISGGHFNPAISCGVAIAGKLSGKDLIPYIISQVIGAFCASLVLYWIASGNPAFDLSQGFATNGYGTHSPGGYNLLSCFLMELIMSFAFVLVVLGSTSKEAPSGFAPIAIGLALTLILLVALPVTNASVNPARATGPAIIRGAFALQQLWLFWVAPILGGVIAGGISRPLFKSRGIVTEIAPERPLRQVAGRR